jgi:segregation and condensation protein B
MEISNLIPHIEALIFASEKPLTTLEITDLINNAFGFMEDKITLDQIESAIEGILEKYRAEFYPFEVRESGGGWQFLTKKDYHKTVAQLNGDKFLKRLSTAALETLSIIAYKQPVTKGEIEAIRGVSSDYAIQKLLEKDLIVITGRNEALPGHPLVYATSKNFMDYFGLNSPEDLPKLKEVFDDNFVSPTAVSETAGVSNPDAETTEPIEASLNGVSLNGTELEITEKEEEESGEELSDTTGESVAGEEAEMEELEIDSEASEEASEEEADIADAELNEELIEEEAEALDEEAGEVLDEIAELEEEEEEEMTGEEGDETYEYEEEEPYITPEEEEDVNEDNGTTFKVDEDGELIEESTDSNDAEDTSGDDESGDDEDDEEDKPDEEKK